MKATRDISCLPPDNGAMQLYTMLSDLPRIDYRCRISPAYLAANRPFANVTALCLTGDAEKQRAMRNCGISESLISGNASDFEKLHAFLSILPSFCNNPLIDRTREELHMLGYDDLPCAENAEEIWTACNETIWQKRLTPYSLLSLLHVAKLYPITEPSDPLTSYDTISRDSDCTAEILPLFCPDGFFYRESSVVRRQIDATAKVSGRRIDSLDSFCTALFSRMDAFAFSGCRSALHTLPPSYRFLLPDNPREPDNIFLRLLSGNSLSEREQHVLCNALLLRCAQSYTARRWVLQLQIGVMHDANTLLHHRLGDHGCRTVRGLRAPIAEVVNLLNLLTAAEAMPRILLSCDAPADFASALSAVSAFQTDYDGMPRILPAFSPVGICSAEDIGLQLTSLASHFPLGFSAAPPIEADTPLSCLRANSFRRLLCAQLSDATSLPSDALSTIATDLCYTNLARFFRF